MLKKSLFKNMQLPSSVKKSLALVGNHGLSRSTWSNYRTAEKMLLICRKYTGRKMELPLKQGDVLVFIDWLIRIRKVKHGTISSYLAGLRQLHIAVGLEAPNLRTSLVNTILRGKRHMDVMEKKRGKKADRLPVTLNVMNLIKATLKISEIDKRKKLMTWAVCCLAFQGSFRIHEILSKEERRYDPIFTLLVEDLTIVEEASGKVIHVNVKWPKEEKEGKDFIVEVLETKSETCPVKALLKWWASKPIRKKGLPAFRSDNGRAWTGREFNSTLKALLSEHLDYKAGKITAHSFRSGVPTMLGKAGFRDEDIRAVGRWSSRAFGCYTKLPRTKRREMAEEVSKIK